MRTVCLSRHTPGPEEFLPSACCSSAGISIELARDISVLAVVKDSDFDFLQLPMSSVSCHNATARSRVGLQALPLAFWGRNKTIARGLSYKESPEAHACRKQSAAGHGP